MSVVPAILDESCPGLFPITHLVFSYLPVASRILSLAPVCRHFLHLVQSGNLASDYASPPSERDEDVDDKVVWCDTLDVFASNEDLVVLKKGVPCQIVSRLLGRYPDLITNLRIESLSIHESPLSDLIGSPSLRSSSLRRLVICGVQAEIKSSEAREFLSRQNQALQKKQSTEESEQEGEESPESKGEGNEEKQKEEEEEIFPYIEPKPEEDPIHVDGTLAFGEYFEHVRKERRRFASATLRENYVTVLEIMGIVRSLPKLEDLSIGKAMSVLWERSRSGEIPSNALPKTRTVFTSAQYVRFSFGEEFCEDTEWLIDYLVHRDEGTDLHQEEESLSRHPLRYLRLFCWVEMMYRDIIDQFASSLPSVDSNRLNLCMSTKFVPMEGSFLDRGKGRLVGVWQDPIQVVFTKDCLGEHLVDSLGFCIDAQLWYPYEKENPGSLRKFLSLEIADSDVALEMSFRVGVWHHPLKGQQPRRKCVLVQEKYLVQAPGAEWVRFADICEWDFELYPECAITFQYRIDRFLQEPLAEKTQWALENSATLAASPHEKEFRLELQKFGRICDGRRRFSTGFELARLPWELIVTISDQIPRHVLVEILLAAPDIILETRTSLCLQDFVCSDPTLYGKKFGRYYSRDWWFDREEVENIRLVAEIEFQRVFQSAQYLVELREKNDRLSALPLPQASSFPLSGKKIITLPIMGNPEEEFEECGLPWKFVYHENLGRTGQGATFLHCLISKSYLMRCGWVLRLPDFPDFSPLEMQPYDSFPHHEDGLGFVKWPRPATGKLRFELNFKCESLTLREEYLGRLEQTMKEFEDSGVTSAEAEILLRSKGAQNPVSTHFEAFGGIPFSFYLLPFGMNEEGSVACVLQPAQKVFVKGHFALSTWSEVEQRRVDLTVTEILPVKRVYFSRLVNSNVNQDWTMTLRMSDIAFEISGDLRSDD